jgi:hypothetical protein
MFKESRMQPLGADRVHVSVFQLAVDGHDEVETLAGSKYVRVCQKAMRSFPVKILTATREATRASDEGETGASPSRCG